MKCNSQSPFWMLWAVSSYRDWADTSLRCATQGSSRSTASRRSDLMSVFKLCSRVVECIMPCIRSWDAQRFSGHSGLCLMFLFIKNEVDALSLLTNGTLTFSSDFGLLRLSDKVLVLVRKHEITVSVTGLNTNFTGSSVKRHSKKVYWDRHYQAVWDRYFKQLVSLGSVSYWGAILTCDSRCSHEALVTFLTGRPCSTRELNQLSKAELPLLPLSRQRMDAVEWLKIPHAYIASEVHQTKR